ncbi:MAG: hypothetical protein LQ340_003944 [Diploschistes diacapsis]|nr:MAG: hypothetical protein LQ340_003944 [Diploschistes diacapsis]
MSISAASAVAASSAAPTWDPGVTAPYRVSTDDDQRGFLTVMTATALSFVFTGFVIRAYSRVTIGGFKPDDWILTAATILAIIQSAVVFSSIQKGFGLAVNLVPPTDYIPMLKSYFASDALYLLTLLFSKLGTAFIYLRLTPEKGHSIAAWTNILLCTACFLLSFLLTTITCHPSEPWTDTTLSTCPSLFTRWALSTALSLTTELSLFSLSIYLVWTLKMPLRSKAIVVSAFAARLGALVPAALRLVFLGQAMQSDEPTFLGTAAVAAAQFELGYGLLASMVPCLKPFMATYEGPLRPAVRARQYYDRYYGEGEAAAGARGGVSNRHKLSNYSGGGSASLEEHGSRLGLSGLGSSGQRSQGRGEDRRPRIYTGGEGKGVASTTIGTGTGSSQHGHGHGAGGGMGMGAKGRKSLDSDSSMQAIIPHSHGNGTGRERGGSAAGRGEVGVAVTSSDWERGSDGSGTGLGTGLGGIKKEVGFCVETESIAGYNGGAVHPAR